MIAWQHSTFKPWLRSIAFLTAFVFAFMSVVWDGGLGSAQAAATQAPLSTTAPFTDSLDTLIDHPNLPDVYGTIKSTFKGERDQIVIHVQDAHINEEAQRNIAAILSVVSNPGGPRGRW